MEKSLRLWLLAIGLLGFSSLVLWNCNVSETPETNLLEVKLNDSLTFENGFDSIDIDLYDGNGTLVQADLFHGPYHASDAGKLSTLPLNAKPPDPFEVRITAYKDSNDYYVFKTLVTDQHPVMQPTTHHAPSDTGEQSGVTPTHVVIVNPVSRTLYVGDSAILLISNVEPADAPSAVTWTVSDANVAAILAGNKLKALAPGTVILKAASTGTPSVSDTLIMTVKPQPTTPPASIQITSANPLILTVGGASISLAADVLPVDAAQTILWTLPFSDIAVLEAGNKIKGLKAGTVQAKAASAIAPTVFSYLDVTVNEAPSVPPVSIIPKDTALTLTVGAPSVALTASVLPVDASQGLIWSLESPGVAEIVNGNQIRGLKAGSVKALATSAVKSAVTASIKITVIVPVVAPDSISLRMPTPITMAPDGALSELAWAVLPAGADQGVQWTSSDINVAQITEDYKVKSFAIGKATLTGKSKSNPSVTTSFLVNVIKAVKVDGITITPAKMTLYTGGPVGKVSVAMAGNDTGAQYSLASSDAAIATVAPDGSVKGLAVGVSHITASVVGYPAITSVCSVTVVKDEPVVTVSPNQNVAFNGEATFSVSVAPQAYGTTVEIKADMDGDNVFEQTVLNKETADFKQKYTEVKTTTVSFTVKDTEGNEVTVTRKVIVGAPGAPIVSIVNPSKDTTITSRGIKVRFTVKDTAQKIDTSIDSTVAGLVDGPNTLKVSRKNAGGEGTDQVIVTVDLTPPAKPVFTAPAQNPTTNNRPTWKWTAVADAVKYQVKFDSDTTKDMINVPTGTQYQPGSVLADGEHILYLRAVDAVGNVSALASQSITTKASLPATPVSVTPPAAISSNRLPEWKWKTGDALKGKGTYHVWLNDAAQPDVSTPSFKPANNLGDGKYTLKVKETDALGQESAAYLTFSQITVDGSKPTITASYASGSVTIIATTTKVTVTGAIVDGSSGSGIQSATYALSGKTVKAATAISSPGSFNLSAIALNIGGVTTMTLTATDFANNTQTYIMDFNVTLKIPVVKFVSPTPRDGYISNSTGDITIYYTVDGVDATPVKLSITEPTDVGVSNSKAYRASASNEAGTGYTDETRTFYRVNRNVVFFKPSGGNSASCADWENACSFAADLTKWSGKTLWMSNGEYNITGTPTQLINLRIFGGLNANGTDTKVQSGVYSHVFANTYNGNGHEQINVEGPTAEFNHLSFSGAFGSAAFSPSRTGTFYFNDCKFYDFNVTTPYYGVGFYVSAVTNFTRCTFDNTKGEGSMIYFIDNGNYLTFTSCTFKSSVQQPGPYFDVESPSAETEPLPLNSYRFYTPVGTEPYLRGKSIACGLPGTNSCPAK